MRNLTDVFTEIELLRAAMRDVVEAEGGKFWIKNWQGKHAAVIARAMASPERT